MSVDTGWFLLTPNDPTTTEDTDNKLLWGLGWGGQWICRLALSAAKIKLISGQTAKHRDKNNYKGGLEGSLPSEGFIFLFMLIHYTVLPQRTDTGRRPDFALLTVTGIFPPPACDWTVNVVAEYRSVHLSATLLSPPISIIHANNPTADTWWCIWSKAAKMCILLHWATTQAPLFWNGSTAYLKLQKWKN